MGKEQLRLSKEQLLLSCETDAEFEELWQRLSRESRPATPPSAPATPRTLAEAEEDLRTEQERAASQAADELREVLEHEPRGRDARPPGWGLLIGLEPFEARRSALGVRGAAGSSFASTSGFEQSVASAAASPPRPRAAGSGMPEPVRAVATTSLATAVKAELARRAEEQAVLEARQRALAAELDDADEQLDKLRDAANENDGAWDYDESGEVGAGGVGLAESSEEEEDVVDERHQQRLRWADMLRAVFGDHLAHTRRKLGAHALWKAAREVHGETAAPPLRFVDQWVGRTGRRVIRPDVPPVDFIAEWLSGRNGQQRDVADVSTPPIRTADFQG